MPLRILYCPEGYCRSRCNLEPLALEIRGKTPNHIGYVVHRVPLKRQRRLVDRVSLSMYGLSFRPDFQDRLTLVCIVQRNLTMLD